MFSHFAYNLNSEHCGEKSTPTRWPERGDAVAYSYQKEAHLRGKNVRVRAKVAACWLADWKFPQVRLTLGDISQFEGVD